MSGKEEWTEIITPRTAWFDLRLQELWQYRDLIILFVKRDFVTVYKQTILGPLWHLIQPVMTTLVFTVVFANIAQIPTDGQPAFLFYLCGTTLWGYFAQCFTRTSSTFLANAGIFGKVYFPRMTVPVSVVISSLFSLGVQMLLFTVVYVLFWLNGTPLRPSWWLLCVPFLVIQMAVLGLSLGIIVSSLTTKYRDLTFLIGFGVQLLMYASPVIYPLSIISPKYQFILSLNPVTPILEVFRFAFFGTGTFNAAVLSWSFGLTFFLFLIGLALFHRVEKTFMDTI
ncbi:MAG TPA: ABC transporter permease [Microscillaceae bacterium]|nr:ABC transporter permease [Microscillaceae bacterium]